MTRPAAFTSCESPPSLASSATGLRIARHIDPRGELDPFVPIDGCFRLSPPAAAELERSAHHALVVVLQLGGAGRMVKVFQPFAEAILFADDQREDAWGVAGTFRIELARLHGERPAATWHVFASLGREVSNVIMVPAGGAARL